MVYIKKEQIPILIVNVLVLIVFSVIFSTKQNWEFLAYVGLILFFLVLIISTNRKVNYPPIVLLGLTLWAAMHLAGGGIRIGDSILYKQMLITLSTTYPIIRYDQLVHFVGFGVATLFMYYLIKPILTPDYHSRKVVFTIVILMAGLGVGALNEIIEFMVTVFVPENGVGGYINTSLDLVADLVGAIAAVIYLNIKGKKLV
jgi:uncharacterized membrane protein YjdF